MNYTILSIIFVVSIVSLCEADYRETNASIVNYPYTVSVQKFVNERMMHAVGGVVVSGNVVLSAAHYFVDFKNCTYFVRAGSEYTTTGGQWREIISATLHPQFDENTLDYNIAVLKVAQNFDLGDVQPIAMASPSMVLLPGTLGSVSGWQTNHEVTEDNPEPLQAVTVPIVDHDLCVKLYAGSGYITPSKFCAGNLDIDTEENCVPYAGFPFVVQNVLHGIYAWGFQCYSSSYPGVYINIAGVRNWINVNL